MRNAGQMTIGKTHPRLVGFTYIIGYTFSVDQIQRQRCLPFFPIKMLSTWNLKCNSKYQLSRKNYGYIRLHLKLLTICNCPDDHDYNLTDAHGRDKNAHNVFQRGDLGECRLSHNIAYRSDYDRARQKDPTLFFEFDVSLILAMDHNIRQKWLLLIFQSDKKPLSYIMKHFEYESLQAPTRLILRDIVWHFWLAKTYPMTSLVMSHLNEISVTWLVTWHASSLTVTTPDPISWVFSLSLMTSLWRHQPYD